ncbi:MAG: hypothetical protein Kow0019_11690 [Methanobacteriaceae archaeon]
MVNKDELKAESIKQLQTQSLSYEKLKNKTKSSLEKQKKEKVKKGDMDKFESIWPSEEKTYKETVMELLRENKIQIIGYDFSVYSNRMQSIKVEGLVFSLVKTQFVEILPLIDRLDKSTEEDAKNAYEELFNRFKIKTEEYENKQFRKYEELESKMQIKPLKDFYDKIKEKQSDIINNEIVKFIDNNYIKILKKIRENQNKNICSFTIENVMNSINDIHGSKLSKNVIKDLFYRLYYRIIPKILNKYENAKIMLWKDANFELPNRNFKPVRFLDAVLYGNIIKLEGIIDLEGNLTFLDFLDFFNIRKPKRMSITPLASLFHQVILETIDKKDNETLKKRLANALSDSEESLKCFEYIILESKHNYSSKLDKLNHLLDKSRRKLI